MDVLPFDAQRAVSYRPELMAAPIARFSAGVEVQCLYVGAGAVAERETGTAEALLVIEGRGWVRGGGTGSQHIAAGSAAVWGHGEPRALGTEVGIVAVSIRSLDASPS